MKVRKIISVGIFSFLTCNLLYASQENKNTLDSITVTANKIEENVQDVPQSIAVIEAEELEKKGIDNVYKLINELPNMNAINLSGLGTFANFRGLNTSLFNLFSSPIVFYIDGVPTMNRYVYEASLTNVKKVEVLRGPQGTLYGKDSIGAIINIVTNDTPENLTGYVGAEYGSDNYSKTSFNLRAPLSSKKVYAGINGEYKKDDGELTNTYNNDDKAAKSWMYNTNAYVKFLPTDRLSLKFTVNKYKSKNYGADSASYTTSLDSLSESKAEDTKTADYNIPTSEDRDVNSQSMALKYSLDDFDIDWVLTHKDVDFDGVYDYDFTTNTSTTDTTQYNNFTTKSYSNEVRLSNSKKDIKWLIGLYADNEKFNESTGYDNYSYFGKYDNSGEIKSETQAIFANAIVPLNKVFELTLGGRYQKIKKEVDIDLTVENYPTSNKNYVSEKTWNVFLPKIALAYKGLGDTTPYISVSKGYMPGGYNTTVSTSADAGNLFEAQKTINYEAGIKGLYNDFQFNTSIFYMDIKDLQVYGANSISNAWYVSNADKAHSYGLELEGKYFLSDTLDISGSLGLVKAVYDEYVASGKTLDGKDIENTPSHTANLTLTYTGDSGLYGLASIYNRGGVSFYDVSTQKFLDEGSATTANIKVGHRFSKWDIYGYVNNITDERYVTGYFSKGILTTVSYNESRFVGIGVKYNF